MTAGLSSAKTVAVPLFIIFMGNEKDELLNGTEIEKKRMKKGGNT